MVVFSIPFQLLLRVNIFLQLKNFKLINDEILLISN